MTKTEVINLLGAYSWADIEGVFAGKDYDFILNEINAMFPDGKRNQDLAEEVFRLLREQ